LEGSSHSDGCGGISVCHHSLGDQTSGQEVACVLGKEYNPTLSGKNILIAIIGRNMGFIGGERWLVTDNLFQLATTPGESIRVGYNPAPMQDKEDSNSAVKGVCNINNTRRLHGGAWYHHLLVDLL